MPNPPPSHFLPLTIHYLSSLIRLLSYRKILLFQLTLASSILLFHLFNYLASPSIPLSPEPHSHLLQRDSHSHLSTRGDGSYGGFETRPQTEKCYRQEKIATLLGVFLGIFGADHWYARHWVLAVFKLLTAGGFAIWWIVDIVLWVLGGFYGTPGCGGGCGREWVC